MRIAFVLAALMLSGCATFTTTSSLARDGVFVSLAPDQTERSLSELLKSRGAPIAQRAVDHQAVKLKFTGPTASVYAEVTPAGDQSRVKLFGASVRSVEVGDGYPTSAVELSTEMPPEWLVGWQTFPHWGDPSSGRDAVSGTLIELQQSGVVVTSAAPADPAVPGAPAAVATCRAEEDPRWASATAREKAALLAACHAG